MAVGDIGGAVRPVRPWTPGAELMRVVARARAVGLDPELELRVTRRYVEYVRDWERSCHD